MDIYTETVR